jgi:hypothetical protein
VEDESIRRCTSFTFIPCFADNACALLVLDLQLAEVRRKVLHFVRGVPPTLPRSCTHIDIRLDAPVLPHRDDGCATVAIPICCHPKACQLFVPVLPGCVSIVQFEIDDAARLLRGALRRLSRISGRV